MKITLLTMIIGGGLGFGEVPNATGREAQTPAGQVIMFGVEDGATYDHVPRVLIEVTGIIAPQDRILVELRKGGGPGGPPGAILDVREVPDGSSRKSVLLEVPELAGLCSAGKTWTLMVWLRASSRFICFDTRSFEVRPLLLASVDWGLSDHGRGFERGDRD